MIRCCLRKGFLFGTVNQLARDTVEVPWQVFPTRDLMSCHLYSLDSHKYLVADHGAVVHLITKRPNHNTLNFIPNQAPQQLYSAPLPLHKHHHLTFREEESLGNACAFPCQTKPSLGWILAAQTTVPYHARSGHRSSQALLSSSAFLFDTTKVCLDKHTNAWAVRHYLQ